MLARPGKRATLARRDTALVIDGFLRSGNTFSVAAFQVANGTDAHLGRHLHGGPHLRRALRLGVPAVLLIRRPVDAVGSYLVRRPTLTPRDGLLEYLDTYRSAWPARDGFVVGLFDDVTHDFGSVITTVNEKFGTSFVPFEPTPENREAAFAIVEELNRRECGGEVVETHVGRPSAERTASKERIAAELAAPSLESLLAEAEALYEQYADLAAAQRRTSTG
jgi:hypothetical protein